MTDRYHEAPTPFRCIEQGILWKGDSKYAAMLLLEYKLEPSDTYAGVVLWAADLPKGLTPVELKIKDLPNRKKVIRKLAKIGVLVEPGIKEKKLHHYIIACTKRLIEVS